jgi:hypothetical protein
MGDVPTDPVDSTDADREESLDRVPLWLDREDLSWLARRCTCNETTDQVERDRCARIRFRASAALHKNPPTNP